MKEKIINIIIRLTEYEDLRNNPNVNLIEEDILDSLAFIELIAELENEFDIEIIEKHHNQKLDAPSGTAITLAEGILANSSYESWTLDPQATDKQIHIDAVREDQVPGTHTVRYDSSIDQIEIKHTAHNREGFALGAVVAAEWLKDKKGIFSMKDVLNLKK